MLRFRSSPIATRLTLVGLLSAALCVGAQAQSKPGTSAAQAVPILKGEEVNEERLVNALDPDALGTRQILVSRVKAPARRPAASLLITFETNSTALTPDARAQLDVVAAALKNEKLKSYSFVVEGHADPRGAADANQLLSQQRAESVRDYLVTSHGVAQERLHSLGKGASEPANKRVPSAPENRRVTIATKAS